MILALFLMCGRRFCSQLLHNMLCLLLVVLVQAARSAKDEPNEADDNYDLKVRRASNSCF